ncbi:hypothetical protein A5482_007945 [Cyanobacterium sp. IPPAS B-1200]|uniref:hypothetical protein n=1 Tax=Cyanobacterium sp. IPPAS B-1200 TaxID=1562720 RepID=UPI0019145BA6|nr:hypothetical protein [Cyanobacterium sp. IPPAS B-1200]
MSKKKKQNSISGDIQPSFPHVPGFSSPFKSDLPKSRRKAPGFRHGGATRSSQSLGK